VVVEEAITADSCSSAADYALMLFDPGQLTDFAKVITLGDGNDCGARQRNWVYAIVYPLMLCREQDAYLASGLIVE
jgi:hypothetical protein